MRLPRSLAGLPTGGYNRPLADRWPPRRRALILTLKVGRSVAQPGSALASGARGREFESPRSDQYLGRVPQIFAQDCAQDLRSKAHWWQAFHDDPARAWAVYIQEDNDRAGRAKSDKAAGKVCGPRSPNSWGALSRLGPSLLSVSFCACALLFLRPAELHGGEGDDQARRAFPPWVLQ